MEVSTVCFHQFEDRGLHIMQFCNTTPSISQVKSSSLSIFNAKQQLCRIFKPKSLWSFHILCHSITSVYKTNTKPGGLCSILGQVWSGGSASTKFCVEQKPRVMHLSHWNIGKHWTKWCKILHCTKMSKIKHLETTKWSTTKLKTFSSCRTK